MATKTEYRRHLPHQIPEGSVIFLTWNLKGAMPRAVFKNLCQERDRLKNEPLRNNERASDRALRHGKVLFAMSDDFLDRATNGPLYLREPECAEIVENSILFGASVRYELFAWCVMPNHVHAVFAPLIPLAKITQGLKGFTAREINRLQSQVGRTFWQDESYDHWARDEDELLRIIAYVESNPVKAGWCADASEWPWSSARRRNGWKVGEPLPIQMNSDLRTTSSGWKA